MAQHTDDVSAVLRRASIKPAEIKRKPRQRGPKPVPELDEHVQASYESGEAYELTVPEQDTEEATTQLVEGVKSKIRASAKYVGHELGVDIRVTLQTEAVRAGRVTVRFRARPPLNMGRRASQAKKAAGSRSRKKS